jgi:hypothetical protein
VADPAPEAAPPAESGRDPTEPRPVERSGRIDPAERRTGLVLLAVLLMVAGAAAVSTGAVSLASIPREVQDHNAACRTVQNCTLDGPASGQPGYRWAEVTVGVGAVLLVVGAGAILRARRPPIRPPGSSPDDADSPSAPNYK